MTDDTATDVDMSPAERSRRVRDRARRGVVTSDPPRLGEVTAQLATIQRILADRPGPKRRGGKKPAPAPTKCEPPENPLRMRLKAAHLAPFEKAGEVFWAVAEVECDYDFTTTTEMKGDSYVITMAAKPRPRHVRVTVVHP